MLQMRDQESNQMAEIRIGILSYERPDNPGSYEDVQHVLAVAGKDVVRLAWQSMAPYTCEHYDSNCRCSRGPWQRSFCTKLVQREHLAAWLCQFFNLRRDCGQGNACINQLVDAGVLISHECSSGVFSTYVAQCGPNFSL